MLYTQMYVEQFHMFYLTSCLHLYNDARSHTSVINISCGKLISSPCALKGDSPEHWYINVPMCMALKYNRREMVIAAAS